MSKQRELTYGPWTVGIDNVSPDTALAQGALRDAVNVDLDRAGDVFRRKGRIQGLAGAGLHSGWYSRVRDSSYCVNAGVLSRVHCDGSAVTTAALATLDFDLPTSFDDVDDRVIFSNAGQIGVVQPDDSVIPLGVEDPPAPVLSSAAGTMDAGKYAGAISFLANDGEESALSPLVFVDVADGQGMEFTVIPQPTESRVASVKLYRSEAGGKVMFHAATLPVGIGSYLLGGRSIGKMADNANQARMTPGHRVRWWNGFILVADQWGIAISRSFRYGRTDPEHDRIPYPRRPTMLEPVLGGFYVGSPDGVDFYAGTKPDDLVPRRLAGKPPVDGMSGRIDAADLGIDRPTGASGNTYAIWFAQNGWVLGGPDGALEETQRERFRLPSEQWGAVGSMFLNQRRVTAVLL